MAVAVVAGSHVRKESEHVEWIVVTINEQKRDSLALITAQGQQASGP